MAGAEGQMPRREQARIDTDTRCVFMTYAREDLTLVQGLRTGLQRLQHEVWVDDRLSVGQAWWTEILRQIRRCDAVVVAVSPALLESAASAAERRYALQLGKPLLPVCLRAVRTALLPPDLAPLQLVDYCTPGADAAFELAHALSRLPASPDLPDPLPDPPPVPLSYLSDLTARVHAPTLSLDEQLALVARLRAALARESDKDSPRELLLSLQRRDDLYHATAREIDSLLAPATASVQGHRDHGAARTSTVPVGWYPDPTGRHRLRWFDGDWSDWACDDRAAVRDPL